MSTVRLSRDLALDDGRTPPAGAVGAVVFGHAAGEAYEVAFAIPFHAVATAMAPSLTRAG